MANDSGELLIGNNKNNIIYGLGGDDTIRGAGGRDYLVGGTGWNQIYGGDDDDVIFSYLEFDLAFDGKVRTNDFDGAFPAYGDAGNDILVGTGSLDGGDGNDIIFHDVYRGTPYYNNGRFNGGNGNDLIFTTGSNGDAGSGADTVVINGSGSVDVGPGWGYPGDGAVDRIIINGKMRGNIHITGIDQGDIIEFSGVPEIKSMSDLEGRVEYTESEITIFISKDVSIEISNTWGSRPTFEFSKTDVSGLLSKAQDSIDKMKFDLVKGTTGADTLKVSVSKSDYMIRGLSGNDKIFGSLGNDTLDGGRGADSMAGGKGNDTYIVDSKTDVVTEKNGEGKDEIKTSVSYTLAGKSSVETLRAGYELSKDDINLTGNEFSQTIVGNAGANKIYGLDGNDVISGGAGNDWLIGGMGNDKLTGGSGSDIFFFQEKLDRKNNVDTITDFKRDYNQTDKIYLSKSIFDNLKTPGKLSSFYFTDTRQDNIDQYSRIIYDSKNGDLYYDKDGSGKAFGMVKFAHIEGNMPLWEADFFIV